MKTADASLKAFLQSVISLNRDELAFCELFTITLGTGDVLRYTDWDSDVTIGGNTFLGSGQIVPRRGQTKIKVGCDVDDMELDFLVGTDDQGGVPIALRGMTMQRLASDGWLDKAAVLVQRLFWETPGVIPPWSPIWKFSGSVARPSEITRTLVGLDVQSGLQKLQRQVPATIIEPGCPYTLFDARCGVSRSAFAVACTVGAGSTAVLLKAAALTQAERWFDGGYVTFTSGANQGMSASIRSYATSVGIALDAPLLQPPAVGDTFVAYPGCPGTSDACASKFANSGRYGGWPFVPVPETAI
jgi:uncharacterized phage protein (TIGR02218 family)